jgi:hypothetical protein
MLLIATGEAPPAKAEELEASLATKAKAMVSFFHASAPL